MNNLSVWHRENREYPSLDGNIRREIVVVGGGIAGYLTANFLAEARLHVTLIEADKLFSGTTGRTTAKITCNQGNVYSDLFMRYGEDVATLYFQAQTEAMRGYDQLIRKYAIDCSFRQADSYIFSETSRNKLESTFKVLEKAGAECELTDGAPPFKAVCALKMGGQYLFDPLKFLYSLPVKFEIFENTRAVDIDTKTKKITCGNGSIVADKIIVATHFPIINSSGGYYMKLRQSTSYTLAFKQKITDAMYLSEREDGLSLRPFDGGTILGGGDHRTGRTYSGGRFDALERQAEELLGLKGATRRWCAEDVMTFDAMPMAGRYAEGLDDIYVLTGFNKWGMTNSFVCAKLICDLILGNENAYEKIFSPQRHINGGTGAFISNALTNFKEIFLGYFRITSKSVYCIPPDSGKIVSYHGKKRAVYRDNDNKLYVIGSMCPHMHGELKWNGDSKTWDCPCHGSRFDVYGNALSEPSTKCCKFNKGEI